MFKRNKKIVVEMHFQEEGYGGSSTSIPLNENNLIGYLSSLQKDYGEIVITRVKEVDDAYEMHVTTSKTLEYEDMDDRIDDIESMIKNYIKSKAIRMNAYAVLAKGSLKGVFGQEVNSRLKKDRLIRDGYNEQDIEIKPIVIESFKDIDW